ncbi:hypothetical protein NP233_g1476 [Leucocoprinus birnbaumii]|uniref:Transmembrane protein n=1 Tax=Leucocoprinus birnbaumii TaxID=56174 RepID=A0AAD5W0G4_9AGAR|nr:hypothetical protein NP233_g1476 [Leucocoprinus birnbaumii]
MSVMTTLLSVQTPQSTVVTTATHFPEGITLPIPTRASNSQDLTEKSGATLSSDDLSSPSNNSSRPSNQHLPHILPPVFVTSFLLIVFISLFLRCRLSKYNGQSQRIKPVAFNPRLTPTLSHDNSLVPYAAQVPRTGKRFRQPEAHNTNSTVINDNENPSFSVQNVARSRAHPQVRIADAVDLEAPATIQADLLQLQARVADLEAGRDPVISPPEYSAHQN